MSSRELRQFDFSAPGSEPTLTPVLAHVESSRTSLEGMTALVRALYIDTRRLHNNERDYGHSPIPQWDGGVDDFGKQCRPVWPRLARRIVELGADPQRFIAAQFWAMSGRRTPMPNQMYNDVAVKNYEQFITNIEGELTRQYSIELRSITTAMVSVRSRLKWSYDKAMSYALDNMSRVQASALTRYVVAHDAGLEDIATYYHDAALRQYTFQQEAYDAAWGDRIHTEFRREGTELRANMLTI